jgi:glycosyltransferase involved in cell wall biosynthesis
VIVDEGVIVSTSYREPSIQHLSAALQKACLLERLYVPLDVTPIVRKVGRPRTVGSSLTALCRRRTFLVAGTSIAARSDLVYLINSRMQRGNQQRHDFQRALALDRAVRRRLRAGRRPLAIVGMPMSSRLAFQWAKRHRAMTIFNHVNADLRTENNAFRMEAQEAHSEDEGNEVLREQWSDRIVQHTDHEISLADLILVPSPFVRDDLLRQGVHPNRLILLPYGVDIDQFVPRERNNHTGPIRILYVGQVGYRKGLPYIMAALRRLEMNLSSFRVVGPIVNQSRILERRLQGANYIGAVQHDKLTNQYHEADVFVLPSLAEGMALVVLEAMATGLPVIVTREAGYEGVVRDGVEGFIVPARDSEAIAHKIAVLAEDNDLRRRMGRAARRRAEEFSWRRFERQFIDELTARLPPTSARSGLLAR